MSKRQLLLAGTVLLAFLLVLLVFGVAGHARASMLASSQLGTIRADDPFVSQSPHLPGSPDVDPWLLECVDCKHKIWGLTDRSLALDSNQHPHIASGQNMLYYAYFDGTGWLTETVAQDDSLGVSLALDDQDHAWISYLALVVDPLTGDQHRDLKVAYQSGTGWLIETVDQNLHWDMQDSSISLDASGGATIAYFDGNATGSLKYATNSESGWITDTIDTNLGTNGFVSHGLDSQGYAHIGYSEVNAGAIKYAYQDATGWYTMTVASEAYYLSLAVDALDQVHLAFVTNATNNSLIYAQLTENDWYTETVDTSAAAGARIGGSGLSLATDNTGNPSLSYASIPCELCVNLRYASKSGETWNTQDVDTGGETGILSSLALDGAGHPHFGYFAEPISSWDNEGNLKYATFDGAVWQMSDIYLGGIVGTSNSLALDANNIPHVSYYDETNEDLRYATRTGGSWHSELVDDNGRYGGSIALDQSGVPYISYSVNDILKLSWKTASGWLTETVDSEGINNQSTLAVDRQGYAHIVYNNRIITTYTIHDKLRYAYQDAAGWHIEDIPNTLDHDCYDPSLVLDDADFPHVSVGCDLGLKHIYLNGAGWQEQIVDSNSFGGISSIALGDDGYARIAYQAFNMGAGRAYFAYQDAGGWHNIPLERGNFVSTNALSIDADGFAHLLYLIGLQVTYAHQTPGGWQYQMIDDFGDESYSFSLDNNGAPHAIYYSLSSWGLKYATIPQDEPPVAVAISGPELAACDTPHIFTATVEPVDTTLPVLYQWEANGLGTITNTRGLTDTAFFQWETPGAKLITVTVSNAAGTVSNTFALQVEQAIESLSATNDGPTTTGDATTFSATISAGSSISYEWDFGDGSAGVGGSVSHQYTASGNYLASVTARNPLGEQYATTEVTVLPRFLFLPLISGQK